MIMVLSFVAGFSAASSILHNNAWSIGLFFSLLAIVVIECYNKS